MATVTASQVLTTLVDSPVSKDVNQWYAGGTLRNETYPGGISFSPVSIPSFNNMEKGNGLATSILNGNFMFLNAGMTAVSSFMNTGILDLLSEYKSRETAVIRVSIEVYESSNTSRNDTYSGEASFDIEGTIDYTKGNFSLSSVSAINKNSFSLVSLIGADNITLVTSLYNIVTDDKLTFSEKIQAGILGSVKSQASNLIANKILIELGADYTWSTGRLMTTATIVGLLVGQVIGEFFEYALGLDNSIGYGGEIDRTASMILGTPSYLQESGFMGLGGIGSDISYALGLSDYKSNDLTSRGGTYLGGTESLTSSSGLEIEQIVSFETGDTIITGGDRHDDIVQGIDSGEVDKQAKADEDLIRDLLSGGDGGQASSDYTGLDAEMQDDVNDPEFGIDAQNNYDNEDSGSSSDDSGGTYCCTAMVSNNKWKLKRLKKMEIWHKSQPKWWIDGYDVWGKFVAKNILRDGSGIWGKMMNAFYDRKVEGSRFTIYTLGAYIIIYSGVIAYSLYRSSVLQKRKIFDIIQTKEKYDK